MRKLFAQLLVSFHRSYSSRFLRPQAGFLLPVLLLVLCCLGTARVASAQTQSWVSHGPRGGNFYALAIDPATPTPLYAGTYFGGVFKSTTAGRSWFNIGLAPTYVVALAIDPVTPTTLYAGTGAGGVFQSTDGGASWSAINTGLTATGVVTWAIDPVTPTTIYAGAYPGGVFVRD